MNTKKGLVKEKEIRFGDLFIEVLLQWRVIVVGMLIGSLFLALLSYVKSNQVIDAQRVSVEKAKVKLEQLLIEATESKAELEAVMDNQDIKIDSAKLDFKLLEKQMTETQLLNVEYVLFYEQLCENKMKQAEESIYMQIDSNKVCLLELMFCITSDELGMTYNIQKAYEDILHSGPIIEKLASELRMSGMALSEIYGVEKSIDADINGRNTIRLYMKHYDETVCQNAAEVIIDFVEEKHNHIQDLMGEHEIDVLENSVSYLPDSGIENYKVTYMNEISSLRKSINSLKNSFGKLEWRYYDFKVNGKITDLSEKAIEELEKIETLAANNSSAENSDDIASLQKIIETGVTATVGISIKYIILGMLLGMFVCVLFIFVNYIFNNKVRATDNLQDIYGIDQLGQIPDINAKKKLFAFVDRWILKLRDRNKRRFSEEEALGLSVVAVKMAVRKLSEKSVFIVGCDLKERSLEVCELIREKLQEDNLQVKILNNVLYDAQAMVQLEKAKCVVLVEKVGATLYDEIGCELELLTRQDIVILGGILVE